MIDTIGGDLLLHGVGMNGSLWRGVVADVRPGVWRARWQPWRCPGFGGEGAFASSFGLRLGCCHDAARLPGLRPRRGT